jgi:transposase
MSHLRGPDRSQTQLLPACVDDYVPAEAPARFIDAYVEGLNFQKLGFVRAQPADTGRPAYHPADLLKLYLYGYLHRVRSSRRLEAEAARNLEVIWLLRGLRPDFKTIADFRKDNRAAFQPLFQQFNLLCRKMGLFGAELVAIDGCKFKASNNMRRHYTQEQLQELIQKVRGRIDEYLATLDQQDAQAEGAPAAPSRQALQEKLALLRERRGRYDELLGELNTTGQKEISLTDPDSRKVLAPHGDFRIGYNVQVAVDDKHDLIVAQEVTNAANDLGQLASMASAAKTELGVPQLEVVADKGYHAADTLEACEQAGITTYVPAPPDGRAHGKDGQKVFPRDRFRYDATADTYQCPNGQTLARTGRQEKHGHQYTLYTNPPACAACPLRGQCTTAAHRAIRRGDHAPVVERAAARLAAHPEKSAARKETVEHVFGTLRMWHHDAFLLVGLEKVRAEFSLSALVYNLRRVLNVVKWKDLWKAAGLPPASPLAAN